MKKEFLGNFLLRSGQRLTVSDPCYNADVWCRRDMKNVLPGLYEAYAYYNNSANDKRILELLIVNTDYLKHRGKMEFIDDDIGVDAGLCGFFADKPDYTDEDWSAICNYLPFDRPVAECFRCGNKAPFKCEGVVVSSGYGDGVYTLIGAKNKEGKYYKLKLVFH